MKTDISPQYLRDLAAKVEQGTATASDVAAWAVENGVTQSWANGAALLTSIDAQIKYLPMPGWSIASYRDGDKFDAHMWHPEFDRTHPNRVHISRSAQTGEASNRPAAELACKLRARAWELENGNA